MTFQDQAANLRERLRPLFTRKGPMTIAVSGGKGGVGKSSVALNLAIALGQKGKRVLLIDACFGQGSLAILAGVTPRFALGDLLSEGVEIRGVVETIAANVEFISSGTDDRAMALASIDDVDCVMMEVERFARYHDVVVFDMPYSCDQRSRSVFNYCENVVVVTTPEPASVAGAYSLIRERGAVDKNKRFCVLVNQTDGLSDAQATRIRIETLCKKYLSRCPAYLGMVTHESVWKDSALRQVPCILAHPKSAAGRSYDAIAGLLSGVEQKNSMPLADKLKSLISLDSIISKVGTGV